MSRRPHTKSRNGCQNCKRRKVKCDERHPICFNCARHGITCSLSRVATSCSSQSPGSNDEPRGQLVTLLSDPTADSLGRGLELMHHYTTATADTMALRADMQYVWRVTVPEIAYQSPMLMHGILAAAAMHKAYLLPARRKTYLELAAYHQDSGLRNFRDTLHEMGEQNWKPFFCFSSIVTLLVSSMLAHNKTDLRLDATAPDSLQLFVFVRGIRSVLLPYQMLMVESVLAPLVRGVWILRLEDPSFRNPPLEMSPLPDDVFEALTILGEFYETSLLGEKRDDYVASVAELEKAVYLMAHAGAHPEVGMLFSVLYALPDSIMVGLEAADPYAMVLVSYFSVFSKVLERRFWFLAGWAERFFATIDAHLVSHPLLRAMIEWPRRHVFDLR